MNIFNLGVRFGNHKHVYGVKTLKDAVIFWENTLDNSGLGASDSPSVSVVDLETGKTIAWISYNGRVWDGPVKFGNNPKEILV